MRCDQLVVLISLAGVALASGQNQSSPQTPDQGADATQSFISPLGLGTGATLTVTSKGTSVSATAERQLISSVVNFWQVGISGTTDKNGQAQLYSSSDRDAPGFKGKFGVGKSSFIRRWPTYTETGGKFMRQVLCRNMLAVVNRSLQSPASVPGDADCEKARRIVQTAFDKGPPTDQAAQAFDQNVLEQLKMAAPQLGKPTPEAGKTPVEIINEESQAIAAETVLCHTLSRQVSVSQYCPSSLIVKSGDTNSGGTASGGTIKSPEDQKKDYPDLYQQILSGEPGKFQWKVRGSWAPNLTSVDYRAVNNGTPDLATKLQSTQFLNTGSGDIALYYGKIAFGMEGGFGQTLQVSTQNVCSATTAGTYTAQSCDMAMVGKPNPTNAWLASSALQLYPLPVIGRGTPFSPGLQVNFSYVAPTTGGHSSELSFPFYLAPSASPMKFVVGIEPVLDWNTNPKSGNKFSIALFVGARPEIVK